MPARPQNYEELTRLISALLDGQISESERTRLGHLLQADSQARQLYMQMVDQEVELSCLLVPSVVADREQAKVLSLTESASPAPAATSRRGLLGLAAAVVLLLTVLALVFSRDSSTTRTADRSSPPVTGPLLSHNWSEDFEQGLLRGWTGTLTTNNLPPGSRFAINALPRDYPNSGTAYIIQLPENWSEGLFALTTRSVLNVRFRVGNRSHINVFMHTIPSDPGANGYQMYQVVGTPLQGRTGEWRTVSIPFSQFVRKIVAADGGRRFAGGPPDAGEIVTTLSFSSVEEIDLAIDRVEVALSE